MDFREYERRFNAGEDEALVDEYYAEDCEFVATTRHLKGKQALKDFLAWAHDGVREVMRPQLVVPGKDHLFVQVDMDFHCTKPRPDFPFGAMLPGDLITVKFFVTYHFDAAGKVKRLDSVTWPPEYQVSKLPRLGGHPSQLAAFHSYVSAFSNNDVERFPKFYQDDVELELGSVGILKGKQAIVDFYSKMFQQVAEHQIIHAAIAGDDAISLDSTTCFTAIEDAPDFPVMPLKKGEQVRGKTFVHYTLRDGLVSRIHVARAGPMEKVTT
jgi:ketosteroid isomerase-like protein